jgi:LmbE family N-acetylglucosaminyl deacetylase
MLHHCWISLLLIAGCVAIDDGASPVPTAAAAEASAGSVAALVAAAPMHQVLWIGAHPDDEFSVAPLFAELCHQAGVGCHLLVLTDGGKGNCLLGPGACGSSDRGGAGTGTVGAFRIAELARSAIYLNALLRATAFEDTGSSTVLGTMQNWDQTITHVPNDASFTQVQQLVAQTILDTRADIIITFDPRHGLYCHPDHRAAAVLAILAAKQVGFDLNRLLMTEGTPLYNDLGGRLTQRPWVPSDPSVVAYDASAAGTWGAVGAVMTAHRSQFLPAAVSAVDAAPAATQKVFLAAAGRALVDGQFPATPYDAICASEAVWDGRGVCVNALGQLGPCW